MKAIESSQIVRSYFDSIAPCYCSMNRILSLGLEIHWRKVLLKHIKLKPSQTYADIACGAGEVLSEVHKKFPENKILGIDLCGSMLEQAKDEKHFSYLAQGDATNLPIKNNSFDWVSVAYGMRNMSSYNQFLSQMYRIIKPGGTLLILELTPPQKLVYPIFLQSLFKNLRTHCGKNIFPQPGRLPILE